MEMIINNRNFYEWLYEDISFLLDNGDYKENQGLDYKEAFTQIAAKDREVRRKAQNEFRIDICSFANSEGGVMIFGVSETKGIAKKIVGISIEKDDTDKFELDRRNEVSLIAPQCPDISFRFIACEEEQKYIVTLIIKKGFMRPYVSNTEEGIYKFFARRGNAKQPMSYMEVRNMYTQSTVLAEKIEEFRLKEKARVYTFPCGHTAIMQIIPESFFSNSDWIQAYQPAGKNKTREYYDSAICRGKAAPNVDGMVYRDEYEQIGVMLQFFNNGVVEVVRKNIRTEENDRGKTHLPYVRLRDMMRHLVRGTSKFYKSMGKPSKVYLCMSIFGCKGLHTENDFFANYNGFVDRDEIHCRPVEISNIMDETIVEKAIIEGELVFNNSIGVRGLYIEEV